MALVEGDQYDNFLEAPEDPGDDPVTGNRVLGKGGDDTIVGSSNPDGLFGGDGDDVIYAKVNDEGSGVARQAACPPAPWLSMRGRLFRSRSTGIDFAERSG